MVSTHSLWFKPFTATLSDQLPAVDLLHIMLIVTMQHCSSFLVRMCSNIYGLIFAVLLFSCSIGGKVVTYFRIALICWIKKSKSSITERCKHVQATLFCILLCSGKLLCFTDYPDLRKIAHILFYMVPDNSNLVIIFLYCKQGNLGQEKNMLSTLGGKKS